MFYTFTDGDCDCTLEEILVFFTGADKIPPLGFEKLPRLLFLEGCPEKILPTASTCAIELRIPTYHSDFDSFKSFMILGIQNHDGFGTV